MSAGAMPHRPLGGSDLEVSRLALGSWRTFERLPREGGVAVMAAAREHGIDFLDDARYDDETNSAPLPTGYSEVLFGELFREVGRPRAEAVISNKLWWEFWPEQSAAQELDASLGRMGFEAIDLIYSFVLPDGLTVAEAVGEIATLLDCAAQLPYSLLQRDWVESEAMEAALEASGAGVVASYVLAGGALSGKYARPGAQGRDAGRLQDPELEGPLRAGERLRALAERLGASPAALAIAFTLEHPRVVSTLFGATSPAQVAENVSALELLGTLGEGERAELRAIGHQE
jgi:L-glyceraldehyde 3-phosphate reductase